MNIKAHIVEHQQGSDGWMQHRAKALNASELAAAMGISPYMTRAELIRQKATGIAREVDAATQRRFDKGHEAEATARPVAEKFIGDELYASVFAAEVDGMLLSASLDGHTLLNEVTWEHKQANAKLIASLEKGIIPDQYHPQMEQGLMLTGASRCLFTASNGTEESARHVWYESNPKLRAKIIPTWRQFMADVAAYQPAEVIEKPKAEAVLSLPALVVQIKGEVTMSNLSTYKQAASEFIAQIKTDLFTDQDFANAEANVKFCKDAEDKLETVKSQALSQTASIDELMRTIDHIKDQLRDKRLALDKLVTKRKTEIKNEIVAGGISAITQHVHALNAELNPYRINPAAPDFAGAIKSKRTIASLHDAVNTTLANAKIAADAMAKDYREKLAWFNESGAMPSLFADLQSLLSKPREDFELAVTSRVKKHAEDVAAAEARKQAEEKRQQELSQASAPVVGLKPPAATLAVSRTSKPTTVLDRPTDDQIINALAMTYRVHESKVIAWLLDMDLKAASERMAKEFA